MVAYVIFIKERTHNQGELDLYKEMAPAALAGHPITFRIAHGHKEVVEGHRITAEGTVLQGQPVVQPKGHYVSPTCVVSKEFDHRQNGEIALMFYPDFDGLTSKSFEAECVVAPILSRASKVRWPHFWQCYI